jgi:pimeloyl-ACP methyl ester carboxylesterase
MATLFERFASHDGVEIAYRLSGVDGPTVLLAHGLSVTSTVNFATHYEEQADGVLTPVPGPTIETALADAGYRLVLYDARGHGQSGQPRDPSMYSPDAHVDDLQALVEHVGLSDVAVVGYSMGAMTAARVLDQGGVSAAGLCGISSLQVEGAAEWMATFFDDLADCFLTDTWANPMFELFRNWALLDPNADFSAIAAAARGVGLIPPSVLAAASVPVLVLNGGADFGAAPEFDLTPMIPGAKGVAAGTSHHGTAPSDPQFQRELVNFLHSVAPT